MLHVYNSKMKTSSFLGAILLCWRLRVCAGLSSPSSTNHRVVSTGSSSTSSLPRTRRAVLQAVAFLPAFSLTVPPQPSHAADTAYGKLDLTDKQLKEIIKSDVLKRQFLVTGVLTRSVYKPTATFTDEIDTYEMDQWMKGTQRLFVGSKSEVRLVGDVEVSPEKVEFRFDEDLMFNIPFNPVVSLTGKVILTRDETGYITSYREFWDQDTWSVLKSAKF